MATENGFKSTEATNVEIDLSAGEIIVEATEDVRRVEVRVRTADNEGVTAEAVRAAVFRERGDTLLVRATVRMPNMVISSGGDTNISGSFNYVGGVTIIDGRVYDEYGRTPLAVRAAEAPSPVQIIVRMPLGANLATETVSADLVADGRYHRVEANTTSGRIQIDEAYVMEARSVSGHILARLITDRADLGSTSGRIGIRHWEGDSLRVKNVSGDVRISDAYNASAAGRIDVKTVSGHISLNNSRHISDVTLKTVAGHKERV